MAHGTNGSHSRNIPAQREKETSKITQLGSWPLELLLYIHCTIITWSTLMIMSPFSSCLTSFLAQFNTDNFHA